MNCSRMSPIIIFINTGDTTHLGHLRRPNPNASQPSSPIPQHIRKVPPGHSVAQSPRIRPDTAIAKLNTQTNKAFADPPPTSPPQDKSTNPHHEKSRLAAPPNVIPSNNNSPQSNNFPKYNTSTICLNMPRILPSPMDSLDVSCAGVLVAPGGERLRRRRQEFRGARAASGIRGLRVVLFSETTRATRPGRSNMGCRI